MLGPAGATSYGSVHTTNADVIIGVSMQGKGGKTEGKEGARRERKGCKEEDMHISVIDEEGNRLPT